MIFQPSGYYCTVVWVCRFFFEGVGKGPVRGLLGLQSSQNNSLWSKTKRIWALILGASEVPSDLVFEVCSFLVHNLVGVLEVGVDASRC